MRLQAGLPLAAALATCFATVQPVSAPARTVDVESARKIERNYELGAPTQTFVGEAIVRVKD